MPQKQHNKSLEWPDYRLYYLSCLPVISGLWNSARKTWCICYGQISILKTGSGYPRNLKGNLKGKKLTHKPHLQSERRAWLERTTSEWTRPPSLKRKPRRCCSTARGVHQWQMTSFDLNESAPVPTTRLFLRLHSEGIPGTPERAISKIRKKYTRSNLW